MRKINHTEIAAVSGAGLGTFIMNVNETISEVSTLFNSTIKTLSEAPGLEEEFSLTYKALGLSVAKVVLTCFSKFLAKLAD
ncbi:hypothetical protein [Pantoea septica]|uniref:hypothetical protein n=1 Tax=Pantoea septica TaxID=472695 RepID=UPI001C1074B6|nr:hypothetical protein [Pantoea septica]MBU5378930.1 hypothetical protein [Pantoea septica]